MKNKESIKLKIINELNEFKVVIIYKDYFSENLYTLIRESDNTFSFFSGIQFINNIQADDFKKVLSESFENIDDYDFNKSFEKNCKENIVSEFLKFEKEKNHKSLLSELSLEKEISRMKKIAGMIS